MKPLKDIGKTETVGDLISAGDNYWYGLRPRVAVTILSVEDRRELVREAIEKYVRANLISTDETEEEENKQVAMYVKWADELIKSEGI